MELMQLCENFKKEIDEIRLLPSNILERSSKAIKLSREFLYLLKVETAKQDFKSTSDEITFFKKTKQIPLIPLIYYSEIRSFEIQFPKGDPASQRKCIKKKLNSINRFFLYNLDFVEYIESNCVHFDLQYFTKAFFDTYHFTSSKFYFQDPEFSSSHDMLLAKVSAYNKLVFYMQNRLAEKQPHSVENHPLSALNNNLKWTSSKASLIELIYALHHSRVINNGNAEIKDIALSLQHLFNIDISDFYRIYSEIKSRKKSKSKFLDELSANLIFQMGNSDL